MILGIGRDEIHEVERQAHVQLGGRSFGRTGRAGRRARSSVCPPRWRGGPRHDGDPARDVPADRQLLVGAFLLVLHRQLQTLGDDGGLDRSLDLRDPLQVGRRARRLPAGRLAELIGHVEELAERAVLGLLVLDAVVDEVGLQDRVVRLEAHVGLGAAILLGEGLQALPGLGPLVVAQPDHGGRVLEIGHTVVLDVLDVPVDGLGVPLIDLGQGDGDDGGPGVLLVGNRGVLDLPLALHAVDDLLVGLDHPEGRVLLVAIVHL